MAQSVPPRMLPAPIVRAVDPASPGPELEFIFRTLIQLRMDVDDLRRQFEHYRQSHPELPGSPLYAPVPLIPIAAAGGRSLDAPVLGVTEPVEEDAEDEESVVVFKPGVTIQAMEKDAIVAALKTVAGNRRKAAEMLGMGERTLYRKIKEYGIPL